MVGQNRAAEVGPADPKRPPSGEAAERQGRRAVQAPGKARSEIDWLAGRCLEP
jgi:hypothetical protein